MKQVCYKKGNGLNISELKTFKIHIPQKSYIILSSKFKTNAMDTYS